MPVLEPELLSGHATAGGTASYRDQFPDLQAAGSFREYPAGHARQPDEVLFLSSLGIGTYLGEVDDETDHAYTMAVLAAVRSGINVIDTAINYRHQRSERSIGNALRQLIASGEFARDRLLVCTKAGFLTFDGDVPANPRQYFAEHYLKSGIVSAEDIASGIHCMAPKYLLNQIERSRSNLGLETIDVFYVHNPETQLAQVGPEMFYRRLTEAFAALEEAVHERKISWYGVATWNAFRVAPQQRDAVSLERVLESAEQSGGKEHHFRFVQLPFNLAMPEAFAFSNQEMEGESMTLLEAAEKRGIAVVGSAALYQGKLAHDLPDFIRQRLGFAKDSQNAIQFSRSAPGMAVTLIGMSREEHVYENIVVAQRPLAEETIFRNLFSR